MKKLLAAAILLTVIVFASSAFPLDPQEVNSFDRPFMAPYSKTLDDLSLVPAIATALSPAILLSQPSSEYLTIGLMYIESVAITYGSKELIKYLVHRERPYMYDANTPMSLVQDEEHNESFLSGHTALAFNGASFASYVFCKYNLLFACSCDRCNEGCKRMPFCHRRPCRSSLGDCHRDSGPSPSYPSGQRERDSISIPVRSCVLKELLII